MSLSDTFGVEHAFALCYTEYSSRIGPLKKELGRVGILEDTDFVYTFKNPFDPVFKHVLRHDGRLDESPGLYNLTMGHYGILKSALGLGMDRIMVVEDDCRFVKDTERLRRDMGSAPADWEVLLLDSFKLLNEDRGKKGWIPCVFSRSAAAYCISRSGMEKLTGLIESCLSVPRHENRLRHIDGYFDPTLLLGMSRAYRILPNLAIQIETGDKSVSGVNERLYKSIGMDVGDYAGFNP